MGLIRGDKKWREKSCMRMSDEWGEVGIMRCVEVTVFVYFFSLMIIINMDANFTLFISNILRRGGVPLCSEKT